MTTAELPAAGVPLVRYARGWCQEGMQAAISWQGEAAGFAGHGGRISEPFPLKHGEGAVMFLHQRALGGQCGLPTIFRRQTCPWFTEDGVLQGKGLQVVEAGTGQGGLNQVLPRAALAGGLASGRTPSAAAAPLRFRPVLLVRGSRLGGFCGREATVLRFQVGTGTAHLVLGERETNTAKKLNMRICLSDYTISQIKNSLHFTFRQKVC